MSANTSHIKETIMILRSGKIIKHVPRTRWTEHQSINRFQGGNYPYHSTKYTVRINRKIQKRQKLLYLQNLWPIEKQCLQHRLQWLTAKKQKCNAELEMITRSVRELTLAIR
jgi:hypothetical protein